MESTFGITILPDMDGIMKVDENTFVVSNGPDIPVRQICVRKTWPKGPAGMFGWAVRGDGTVPKPEHGWKSMGADPLDPYVYEWAKGCREKILVHHESEDRLHIAVYVKPLDGVHVAPSEELTGRVTVAALPLDP